MAPGDRHPQPSRTAYLGIEPETIWLIATRNVPILREQLNALLARLS